MHHEIEFCEFDVFFVSQFHEKNLYVSSLSVGLKR